MQLNSIRSLLIFPFIDLLQFAGIASLGPSGPADHHHPRSGMGGATIIAPEETSRHASDILESNSYELKLDKSNILMLGPTGTGPHTIDLLITCSGSYFK